MARPSGAPAGEPERRYTESPDAFDTDEDRDVNAFALFIESIQARSSVVEHYLDTVGVDSSILSAPTKSAEDLRKFERFVVVAAVAAPCVRYRACHDE